MSILPYEECLYCGGSIIPGDPHPCICIGEPLMMNEKIECCRWVKLNQYYCNTGCGIKILVHEDDIKNNIYCMNCGKKVEVV
jgi:hypothetical protein